MTQVEIVDLIKEAHRYACPEKPETTEAIRLGVSLAELGIESVSAMEMAGFIENRLGVEFPDDDMATVGSVEGFAVLVEKYHSKKNGEAA